MRGTLLGLLLMISTSVFATPAQVVIVRHGEKPDKGNELSSQGCDRAFMLPAFFANNSVVNRFGPPVALYAQMPSSDSGSLRPIQTMEPTAVALHQLINNSFVRKNLAGVTQDILSNPEYNGRTVIVAWEHEVIPDLAQAFGLTQTHHLQNWPDRVFDEAWVLTFTNAAVAIEIIPESVLPGDNPLGGDNWKTGPTPASMSSLPANVQQACVTNNTLNARLTSLIMQPLPLLPK